MERSGSSGCALNGQRQGVEDHARHRNAHAAKEMRTARPKKILIVGRSAKANGTSVPFDDCCNP